MQEKVPAGDPPLKMRRFDRSSWFTLALALALGFASAWVYRAALKLPVDGWYTDIGAWGRYQPPIFVDAPDGRNPILREGDVLLAIEGIPFEQLEAAAARLEPRQPAIWRTGEEIRYTIRREGQAFDVVVTLGPQPPLLGIYRPIVLAENPVLLSGPLFFLIGAVVFFLRPRQRASQLLFLFGTAFLNDNWMTWVFISQGPADLFSWVTYWPRIVLGNLLWTALILPLFLHLFLAFPSVKLPLRRFPRALPLLLYGSGIVASAAFVISNILGQEDSSLIFVMVFAVPVLVLSSASLLHSALVVPDPVVRAQARWAAMGSLVGMVAPVGLWAIFGGLSPSTPFWVDLLYFLLSAALPISLAIAILRHNLWDIDVIINRTLVYGLLTGFLAGVYFTSVVLLQELFRALSGEESQLAVVGSTLGIAALFHPLRWRVQEFIDKRFYRRRYNSEKTLAAFAATARDEVDLERLANELLHVVRHTTQPEHTSLWLKKEGSGRK